VALSTDYEVILISRIAEHYRLTGDNRGAVVSGIEHTGSVITSAAAIMIAVFAGFALAGLMPLKQLGVGLGLAVFLDATVVRGVLVPAAMAVMGRGNWWWPRYSRQQHSTALPQKIAAMADVGSVSVRDEKQAVGAFDEHLGATLTVDLGAAEQWPAQRYVSQEPPTLPQKILTRVHEGSGSGSESGAGAAETLPGRQQRSGSGAGRTHHAADVEQTIVPELPW
jgi:MMPL family